MASWEWVNSGAIGNTNGSTHYQDYVPSGNEFVGQSHFNNYFGVYGDMSNVVSQPQDLAGNIATYNQFNQRSTLPSAEEYYCNNMTDGAFREIDFVPTMVFPSSRDSNPRTESGGGKLLKFCVDLY